MAAAALMGLAIAASAGTGVRAAEMTKTKRSTPRFSAGSSRASACAATAAASTTASVRRWWCRRPPILPSPAKRQQRREDRGVAGRSRRQARQGNQGRAQEAPQGPRVRGIAARVAEPAWPAPCVGPCTPAADRRTGQGSDRAQHVAGARQQELLHHRRADGQKTGNRNLHPRAAAQQLDRAATGIPHAIARPSVRLGRREASSHQSDGHGPDAGQVRRLAERRPPSHVC